MPHYLVELDELRTDARRYAQQQEAQPDEAPEPEVPTDISDPLSQS